MLTLVVSAVGLVMFSAICQFNKLGWPSILTPVYNTSIDLKALKFGEKISNNNKAYLEAEIIQGVDQETSKKIIRIVKDSKIKVQSSIQGESVRVSGKKIDDLQDIMNRLKSEKLDVALQFINFKK